ncbi:MAG: ABC transporter permease, partial [Candidatus Methanomethyliaceae archaeon]
MMGRAGNNLWSKTWRRFSRNRAALFGLLLIVVLAILAIGAPWLAPYHYAVGDVQYNFARPNKEHWFGCDYMGRDLLSRLIYGARVSLTIAFVSAATSFLIGVSYGIISGYFGGAIDNLMMRFVDVAWGFPTLLLIILMMVFFKSSFAKVTPGTLAGTLSAIDRAMGGMFFICIGIGLTAWLMIARLARGMTLAVRERDFVEAARACGA